MMTNDENNRHEDLLRDSSAEETIQPETSLNETAPAMDMPTPPGAVPRSRHGGYPAPSMQWAPYAGAPQGQPVYPGVPPYGAQVPGTPYPGGQYPAGQVPGAPYPGGQYAAGQTPGAPYPGGQYPAGQVPGVPYADARYPVASYPALNGTGTRQTGAPQPVERPQEPGQPGNQPYGTTQGTSSGASRAASGEDRVEDLKTAPFYNEKYRKPGKGRMKGLVGPMIAIGLICSLIGSAITGGVLYAYRSDLFLSLAPQASVQPVVPTDTTIRKVEILNRTDEPITAIAEKAGPSVVGINVEYTYNDSFFGSQPGVGQGSGIIISADGYILTNNHVVEAAANTGTSRSRFSNTGRITVVLPSHPEDPYEATIIGLDAKTDIAVIKIDAQNLPVAEIGDSDALVVGELAVAIGNPAGLEYMGSVTSGIISGLNRRVDTGDGNMLRLIQTDAAISPGNSGGALLNAEGQVVGVNSSKIGGTSYEGLGFAIPIKDAMDIAESLMADGFVVRPQIGVSIDNTFTAEVAKANKVPEGVLVGSVMEDSPADKAGIRQYDIITALNGVEVKTYDELEEQKNKFNPGDTITLTIYRIPEGAQPAAGESMEISLTLGSTANSR